MSVTMDRGAPCVVELQAPRADQTQTEDNFIGQGAKFKEDEHGSPARSKAATSSAADHPDHWGAAPSSIFYAADCPVVKTVHHESQNALLSFQNQNILGTPPGNGKE